MKPKEAQADSVQQITKPPEDNKPWVIMIFTKLFAASLTFKGHDRALKNYNGILETCGGTDEAAPKLISINDDIGSRLSFMTNAIVGIKLENQEDTKGKVLRDLQIEHLRLMVKELKNREEPWKDLYNGPDAD